MSCSFLDELLFAYNYFCSVTQPCVSRRFTSVTFAVKEKMFALLGYFNHHLLYAEVERILKGMVYDEDIFIEGGGEAAAEIATEVAYGEYEKQKTAEEICLAIFRAILPSREKFFKKINVKTDQFDTVATCRNLMKFSDLHFSECLQSMDIQIIYYFYTIRRLIDLCTTEKSEMIVALMNDYYLLLDRVIGSFGEDKERKKTYHTLFSSDATPEVITYVSAIFPPVLVSIIFSYDSPDNEVVLQKAMKLFRIEVLPTTRNYWRINSPLFDLS